MIFNKLTRRNFLRLGVGTLAVSHCLLNDHSSKAQTPSLLEPVAHVELPQVIADGDPLHAAGMWARGTLAAVPAFSLAHLIEFSDIKNPQVVTIDLNGIAGDCRDVDFYENYLICGLIEARDNRRVLIYDVRDWKNPKLVSTVRSTDYSTVHNVFVAGKVCFLPTIGSRPGELYMLDLSDPTNPGSLGAVRFLDRAMINVHDVTVIGNRLYAAAWTTGIWIVDFENLDNPKKLSYKFVAQHIYKADPPKSDEPFRLTPRSHNVWPSPDGKLLFTTDEVKGEFVRVFDISNLNEIKLVGWYGLGPESIPHNAVVDGPYVYISYYAHGVRVIEYANPKEPKEVAAFNPYNGESRFAHGFDGFWDVYPFGKYVLSSDQRSGLWILEKRGILTGK
ncbi:hypothetical protein HY230_06925 [Candidatus Acetothermia bacterium]|nr:hypothetical protein [Candidatus Acetothermia bacterium]